MAKINVRQAGGRKTRQKGLTYFTERTRPGTYNDVERVFYEAWRLRSDGWIQHRIISTRPAAEESIGHETRHSSAFTNFRRFKSHEQATPVDLENLLAKLKLDVVKVR